MSANGEDRVAEACGLLRARGFERLADEFPDQAGAALAAARAMRAALPQAPPPEAEPAPVFRAGPDEADG